MSTEKLHNLKVENYVLFSGHIEDLSLETASHIALRDFSKEVREEPGYIGIFATNKQKTKKTPGSWNIKRLLLVKEKAESQVNEFSTFLCMGRCRMLIEIISLICTLAIWGPYPALSILNTRRVHRGGVGRLWLLMA